MGADARLIEPQRAINADIEVPPWIEPRTRESLSDYAKRIGETFDRSRPFYLGGISFGGMIAQEAARHIKPLGLILIATCHCGRDLGFLRRSVLLSACFTPNWAVQSAKLVAPLLRTFFNPVDIKHDALLSDMLKATTPRFHRWAMQAIRAWQGCEVKPPLIQIHGSADRIIPIAEIKPMHTIDGAGHVMNLTHADAVNRLIGSWLADQAELLHADRH